MSEKVALGGNFLLPFNLLLEQEENYDSSWSHSAEEESVPQRRPPTSDERVSNHFKTEYLFVGKVESAIHFINIF